MQCPTGTIFDLSLTADLTLSPQGGGPGLVIPQGSILCYNGSGVFLGAVLTNGNLITPPLAVRLLQAPIGPPLGTCPTGEVVAVVASGTVSNPLPQPPTIIGPLGVCVGFGP
jgi:hypothetical protein